MVIGYMTLQRILQIVDIHHVFDHNGKYLENILGDLIHYTVKDI